MTNKQLQELENIIDLLSSGSLLVPMNRALTFALFTENEELAHWLECELGGYNNGNPTFIQNSVRVPEHRKVVGYYVDEAGKTLQQYYRDLGEMNFYYLREGVAELETITTKTDMISLQEPTMFEDLSQQFRAPITRFIFAPIAVYPILQAIRSQLVKRLIDIRKSSKTELGALSRTEYLKFLQTLHPAVQQIAGPYFENEHYRSAILDTYIGLIQAIKTKSKVNDKDGSPLIDFVFSPGSPILKVSDSKDEQQGAMMLLKGAVMFIRNTNAHDLIEWNEAQIALEWLTMASALYRTVEASQLVGSE